ncbi:hypothetical protein GCM10009091_28910 [Pseudomonas brenneri]|nr:hypothetical protein GCM10009091_28910 [Pseudomonas brenneri]
MISITLGSLLPDTLALIGMGEWAIPGIAVMISLAPENWVIRFSEKCNSMASGAGPLAPAAGSEDSNFGWAQEGPLSNNPEHSATATNVVLNTDMQGSWPLMAAGYR